MATPRPEPRWEAFEQEMDFIYKFGQEAFNKLKKQPAVTEQEIIQALDGVIQHAKVAPRLRQILAHTSPELAAKLIQVDQRLRHQHTPRADITHEAQQRLKQGQQQSYQNPPWADFDPAFRANARQLATDLNQQQEPGPALTNQFKNVLKQALKAKLKMDLAPRYKPKNTPRPHG